MKIKALAPWFGGKRTMAPDIVAELGPHGVYWEPFCGSMAVLFAKPACSSETVNDLHGHLTTLARVVASDQAAPVLYDRLQRTLFCEAHFREVRARLADHQCVDDVDVAYCFFVECWMGRNGVAGTRDSNTAFCVRYTSNGGDPVVRFRSAVDSIPSWHQRLSGVCVISRDGFEVVSRIEDKAGTVIYVDPPYIRKGAKYRHDFEGAEDHKRLAKLLERFNQTRVVVSYYDEPELEELYAGWTKRRITATKAMVNQGMRSKSGAVIAPEVLFINGPSYVDRELFT